MWPGLESNNFDAPKLFKSEGLLFEGLYSTLSKTFFDESKVGDKTFESNDKLFFIKESLSFVNWFVSAFDSGFELNEVFDKDDNEEYRDDKNVKEEDENDDNVDDGDKTKDGFCIWGKINPLVSVTSKVVLELFAVFDKLLSSNDKDDFKEFANFSLSEVIEVGSILFLSICLVFWFE